MQLMIESKTAVMVIRQEYEVSSRSGYLRASIVRPRVSSVYLARPGGPHDLYSLTMAETMAERAVPMARKMPMTTPAMACTMDWRHDATAANAG